MRWQPILVETRIHATGNTIILSRLAADEFRVALVDRDGRTWEESRFRDLPAALRAYDNLTYLYVSTDERVLAAAGA